MRQEGTILLKLLFNGGTQDTSSMWPGCGSSRPVPAADV